MLNETKKEVDLLDLKNIVESKHKIMGLDLGKKRIGVSISTSDISGALPLRTIQYSGINDLVDELSEIIKTHNVKAMVIGLPINMDGSEGKSSQSIRDKSNKILSFFKLPYCFWDERLSTVGAFNLSSQLDIKVSKKIKNIDQNAAAFILQGAIDYLKN